MAKDNKDGNYAIQRLKEIEKGQKMPEPERLALEEARIAMGAKTNEELLRIGVAQGREALKNKRRRLT